MYLFSKSILVAFLPNIFPLNVPIKRRLKKEKEKLSLYFETTV